jgi:antitoxin CptB
LSEYAGSLTVAQARGLHALMELADNDLLDLLLWRKEPEVDITTMEMSEVLGMLRGGRVGAREVTHRMMGKKIKEPQ